MLKFWRCSHRIPFAVDPDGGINLQSFADDMEFLYTVYASTRTDELAVVDWTEAQKAAADAKKGKVFTRLIKELIAAGKHGDAARRALGHAREGAGHDAARAVGNLMRDCDDPTVPCIVEDGKYLGSGWGNPPRG